MVIIYYSAWRKPGFFMEGNMSTYRIDEYFTKDGALLPILEFGRKVLAEVKFEQREE